MTNLSYKLWEEALKILKLDEEALKRFSSPYAEVTRFTDGIFTNPQVRGFILPEKLDQIAEALYERQAQQNQSLEGMFNIIIEKNPAKAIAVFPVITDEPNSPLSRDIRNHIAVCMAGYSSEIEEGIIGRGLKAIVGEYNGDIEKLQKKLAAIPQSFNAVHLKAAITLLGREDLLVYKEIQNALQPWNWQQIQLTKSAINYKLIPLRRADSLIDNYFPGYKIPFACITTKGSFNAQITSERNTEVERKKGNYICSLGDGGLGKWYQEERMTPRDTIEITSIEPQKVYAIRRKPFKK